MASRWRCPVLEIERKWVAQVRDVDALQGLPMEHVSQGYIIVGGAEVRVCYDALTNRYWMGVKIGTGMSRQEVEVEVSPKEGKRLFRMVTKWRVEKTRYRHEEWEIDVFHGDHKGLVLVEREFKSEAEANAFAARRYDIPGVLLHYEVTGNAAYANQNIAQRTSAFPTEFEILSRVVDE